VGITGRAAVRGAVLRLEFRAGGRRTTFSVAIAAGARAAQASGEQRVTIRRRLPAAQRRVKTGIVKVTFAGNDRVDPDDVRLRAARGKALLRLATAQLANGTLSVNGTISRRARGVVRIRLSFTRPDATTGVQLFSARIAGGRWRTSQRLSGDAAKGGQLSIQFTGFRGANLRGEQLSKAVE
jgi:hypothetical protein